MSAESTDPDIWEAARTGNLEAVGSILKDSPELATARRPYHNRKPIHYAAREGHHEIVQLLLEHGEHPTAGVYPVRESTNPLTLAKDRGHTAAADVLERWIRGQQGATSAGGELCSAAAAGDLGRIAELLDGDPSAIEERDSRGERGTGGNTALHVAAARGQWQTVVELVRRGAEIDARNGDGLKPIHMALNRGFQVIPDRLTAGVLLSLGADYDFWVACALGDLSTAKGMLEGDPAFANFFDFETPSVGPDPLSSAAREGHLEIVRLLLQSGTDPDQERETHRGFVARGRPLLAAAARGHLDIVRLLLEAGANPVTVNNATAVAASQACKLGHDEVAQLIVQYGGSLDSASLVSRRNYAALADRVSRPDADLKDIVKSAVWCGDVAVLRMCLAKEPELDDALTFFLFRETFRQVYEPPTPSGYEDCVRALLAYGCDPNVRGPENAPGLHRVVGCAYHDGRWGVTEEDMVLYPNPPGRGCGYRCQGRRDEIDGARVARPLWTPGSRLIFAGPRRSHESPG